MGDTGRIRRIPLSVGEVIRVGYLNLRNVLVLDTCYLSSQSASGERRTMHMLTVSGSSSFDVSPMLARALSGAMIVATTVMAPIRTEGVVFLGS